MFNSIDFSLPQAIGFAPTLPAYIENPAAVHGVDLNSTDSAELEAGLVIALYHISNSSERLVPPI